MGSNHHFIWYSNHNSKITLIYQLKSYVTLMVGFLLTKIRKERKPNSIYNKEKGKSIYICNIEGEIQYSIEFNISNLIYFNYGTI